MKKTIKLKAMRSVAGIIAIVAVIGFATIACSKKAEAQSSNGSGGSSSGGGASSSRSSAKEAPASDFTYELTKDGRGVSIKSYTNWDDDIKQLVIPSKIEGYPVLEIWGSGEGGAFSRKKHITSIVIPDSVEIIGPGAFRESTNITSIVIPNSVKTIGRNAFYEMKSLTSATLPDGLKVIEAGLFQHCGDLKKVNLPASLEEIQEDAFFFCNDLTELIIPDSIQNVRFTKDYGYGDGRKNEPDNFAFSTCGKLPLATRARIQGWGYTGNF